MWGPDVACVGWDRDEATAKRPLALMMCSEPVEACKSAAGISFSAASIPPQPLRYLCQSHLCAPVSGLRVTISTVGYGDTAAGSTDGQTMLPLVVTSDMLHCCCKGIPTKLKACSTGGTEYTIP